MKKETYVKRMTDKGYDVKEQVDGLIISDGYGFRCFVSSEQWLALNTAGIVELPKEEFEITLKYARTPLNKR